MPQQAQSGVKDSLPADFFDKNTPADTLPADFKFDEGVQEKTGPRPPSMVPGNKPAGGAGGSFDPTIAERAEPYRDITRREVSAAARTVGGTLKAPFDIATAPLHNPKITEDEKKFGFKQDVGPVGKFGQEIERQLFLPLGVAAGWWKEQLSNPTNRSNLLDKILDLAPEAVGAGGGAVVAGKMGEAAIPTAGKAIHESYNPIGVKTRGIRAIEGVEAKAGMTQAEQGGVQAQIDRIMDLGAHGATVPEVVKKIDGFIKRANEAKTEKLPDGSIVETGSAAPGLTFMDLRKFLSALDEKIDWDGMKGTKMEREMKGLRKTLDVEAIKTAHKAGLAADYVKGKRDYARGMKLENKGRVIGGGVGSLTGVAVGAEIGKAVGHPFYGAGFGGSVGGGVGSALGKKVVRGIVEAGLGRENVPSEKLAASEIKAGKSSSVEAARNFGKKGPEGGEPSGGVPKGEPPKSGPGGGETEIDQILRRSNVPEDVQAKVREVIRQNEEMRQRSKAPKGNPNAPPSEIMGRAKAEYEKKYGMSEKAAEMKTAQDNMLKKMDEVNREKMLKSSSGGQAPRHNDAIAQAKKELGPNANISKVLQRADEIERAGRN